MFEETDMTMLHSKIDYTSDIFLEQLNHRICSPLRNDLNELHEQLAVINKKALTRVLQESSTNPLLLLLRMNVVELLEFEEFEVEDDPENPVELDRLLESIDRCVVRWANTHFHQHLARGHFGLLTDSD